MALKVLQIHVYGSLVSPIIEYGVPLDLGNTPGGGVGVLGFSFAGYVPLASQSPCPRIVYFVASYRPHLSHFLGKCNFRDPN